MLQKLLTGKIVVQVKVQDEIEQLTKEFIKHGFDWYGGILFQMDELDIAEYLAKSGICIGIYSYKGRVDKSLVFSDIDYAVSLQEEVISFNKAMEIFQNSSQDNYCTCGGPEKEHIGFNSRTMICSLCGKDKK